MKIKEISIGLSGVIPIASYENLRPSLSATVELEEGEDYELAMVKLRQDIRKQFEAEVSRAKSDLLAKQYGYMRFYEDDTGNKYPSVTSILGWDTDWRVSEDELRQYGARGTIIHKLCEEFLTTGEWPDPQKMDKLSEEVAIVLGGSMVHKNHWNLFSHKEFFGKYNKDIKCESIELTVINKEHKYGGRLDMLGTFEGKRSVMDIKSGGADFRQLAAYAACVGEVEQLVIIPVGRTDNKCGYQKPKVCVNIESEFKRFLTARSRFQNRFGV